MRIEAIGYGAGDRDPQGKPNVLRVLKGERAAEAGEPGRRSPGDRGDERIVKIECEIDDMNPQLFGPLMDGLLAAGALGVFYTPDQMKKNPPRTPLTPTPPPHPPPPPPHPTLHQ